MASYVLSCWEPECPVFWQSQGRAVERRNLWLSIPALTLAFAVWMVWRMVVVNLPKVGFRFSTDQLFWLAALSLHRHLRILHEFDQDDFLRLLPMLRQACKKLLSPAFVPSAAISGPCLTDFMWISG